LQGALHEWLRHQQQDKHSKPEGVQAHTQRNVTTGLRCIHPRDLASRELIAYDKATHEGKDAIVDFVDSQETNGYMTHTDKEVANNQDGSAAKPLYDPDAGHGGDPVHRTDGYRARTSGEGS